MKRFFLAALAFLTLTLLLTGCKKETASDDKIKIGLNFELSGDVAQYGIAEAEGAELAIEQANASGNFDKEIVAIKYDNAYNAAETSAIITRLATEDKVSGVIGPAVSGMAMAQYQAGNQYGVVMISPSATADAATLDANGNAYDFAFRACFIDSYQGAAAANFVARDMEKLKAVVIYDSGSDYAIGLYNTFSEKFTALGGTIVAAEAYIDSDTDFSAILTKINGEDFDVIYIPGYYNQAGLIIKQARELGIMVPIVGPDGFDSPTLVDLAGASNLNDVYFTTAYSNLSTDPDQAAFIEAYKAKYGKEPNMFAALGYDATNLLLAAIQQAGSSDPAAVQQALLNISGFKGVTGTITFDEYHNPIKPVLMVKLVNGEQAESIEVQP